MSVVTRKLPKGIRKHIRREKNRIRKGIPEGESYKTKILTLYKKWWASRIKKS